METGHDTLPRPASGTSSHALGMPEAIALGHALGRLPGQLVIYGIEGEHFDEGPDLSGAVERGAVTAAARICAEVRARQRRSSTHDEEDKSCE